MLEVAKVVGNFLKYNCCLLTEYSNHIAEVAQTGPHMLWGPAVLVMLILKLYNHCVVRTDVPLSDYFATW